MIMMVGEIGEGLRMIDDVSKNATFKGFIQKSTILTPQFYHIFKNLLIIKLSIYLSVVFFYFGG